MPRFRSSSLGAGAIILAFLLLLFHRYGTGLLFLAAGVGLLWYARLQREAHERAGDASAPPQEQAASGGSEPGTGRGSTGDGDADRSAEQDGDPRSGAD